MGHRAEALPTAFLVTPACSIHVPKWFDTLLNTILHMHMVHHGMSLLLRQGSRLLQMVRTTLQHTECMVTPC